MVFASLVVGTAATRACDTASSIPLSSYRCSMIEFIETLCTVIAARGWQSSMQVFEFHITKEAGPLIALDPRASALTFRETPP